MRKLFKTGKTRKEILLTRYIWDFPDNDDLEMCPFKENESYRNFIAAKAMDSFAKSLFKKRCSEIGFYYSDVEDVFINQNEQFFDLTRQIEKWNAWETEGNELKRMCKNLIVPKRSRVNEVIKEIKRWSPEEQAEALQLLAGKKIKITVEEDF